MPHVVVKMYTGRSEAQKKDLADAIVDDVVRIAGCRPQSVSVAIEEFDPIQWPEKVYRPDILLKPEYLYKKPGYNPFE